MPALLPAIMRSFKQHDSKAMALTAYRLSGATGIHKGDREYQQDQLALLTHPHHPGCVMGVVADGMGGRSGGRMASDQVVLTAKQIFERYSPKTDDAPAILRQIGEEAHTVIRLTAVAAEMEPHSTYAAFIMNPEGDCHWAHSGDSRIYHFHAGTLVKRTRDNSYVQTLVDKGELTEMQARDHPQSNILLSCLGAEEPPQITTYSTRDLKIGDALLLCSDGLWHYFTDQELGSAFMTLNPREAAEFLIAKARQRGRGGGDNISTIVLRLDASVVERKSARIEMPSIADIKRGMA